MRDNLCEFCKARYSKGSWEGSHYMTDPITFECGTYIDDKNDYQQSDDCKKKQANSDITKFLMGTKDLDEVLENSPVMELKENEQ